MDADKKISGITDISLKAAKDINITDSFSIPLFAQSIVCPVMDKPDFVFSMIFQDI